MGIETAWLAVLGLLLAGYFVLGGYDYGVGMLVPFLGRSDGGRRAMLNAIGAFFLGNEVWLVAVTGVLFGAFPLLEGTVLSGLYPVVVAILMGLVVGNAAVQLRSRHSSTGGRWFWDGLIFAGSLVPALGWGVVVGNLLQGIPVGADGESHLDVAGLFDPYALLCGGCVAVLFAVHGATFLALRLSGEPAARAGRAAGLLAVPALVLVTAAVVGGVASGDVRAAVGQPLLAAVLAAALLAALAVAPRLLARGRHGRAFAATSLAAALPVLLVGIGLYPDVLVSSVDPAASLTVETAAADGNTLALLGWFMIPLGPIMLLYQLWSWWTFRGRVDGGSPSYF